MAVDGDWVLVHNDCLVIPGNPFRGKNASQRAFEHLSDHHGLDPHVAGNRFQSLKEKYLRGSDDVASGRTGYACDARTGDLLGNLLDPIGN